MIQSCLTIYAVADIHGRADRLEQIDHHVTTLKPDVLVIAGDIAGHHTAVSDIQKLNDLPVPVLAVPGNMDTQEVERLIETCPNIISLHLGEWTIKGVKFLGLGGASQIPFGLGISCREKTIGSLIKEDSVLVAHHPPCGTLDEGFGNIHAGNRSLRRLILEKQPRMLICGHIHEKPGWAFVEKTLVVNCSMGRRGAGSLIILSGDDEPAIRML